jgi:hypothetical protein
MVQSAMIISLEIVREIIQTNVARDLENLIQSLTQEQQKDVDQLEKMIGIEKRM